MNNGNLTPDPGSEAPTELALQLVRKEIKRQLAVDALLIVGIERPQDPSDPTAQTFLTFDTEEVDKFELTGIIHGLMSDVNKKFEDKGMPGPFPNALPFVKPLVGQTVGIEVDENSFIGYSPTIAAEKSTRALQIGDLVEVQSKSNPRFSKLTFTITEFSEVNDQPMACGEYGCFAIYLLTKI